MLYTGVKEIINNDLNATIVVFTLPGTNQSKSFLIVLSGLRNGYLKGKHIRL